MSSKDNANQDIVDFLGIWTRAFSAASPHAIVSLYADDASLWGTLSPIRRADTDAIYDYFDQAFIFSERSVEFHDWHIRRFTDIALCSGAYTFSLKKAGEQLIIPSRYSMALAKRPQGWRIVEHHSSAMPTEAD